MQSQPWDGGPSLAPEQLGELEAYEDDDLLWLRERLVMDIERIQAESAEAAEQIKELSRRRHELQHEAAERARTLRKVKHLLRQRPRLGDEPDEETEPSEAGVSAPKGRAG
jgi:hypothetical protein